MSPHLAPSLSPPGTNLYWGGQPTGSLSSCGAPSSYLSNRAENHSFTASISCLQWAGKRLSAPCFPSLRRAFCRAAPNLGTLGQTFGRDAACTCRHLAATTRDLQLGAELPHGHGPNRLDLVGNWEAECAQNQTGLNWEGTSEVTTRQSLGVFACCYE